MNNKDTRINDIASRMSKRLITNAEMLRTLGKGSDGSFEDKKWDTVADVGCDHGYVSMYLVQHGIADRAIAMDVRKGPLSGAENNISEFGLSDVITTRLSDGLTKLLPGEADAAIIAGMGGKLMIKILEEGDPKALGIKEAVLQPQSDLDEFRNYLRSKDFFIADEKVIIDEEKYYFPMRVVFGDDRGSFDRKGRVHDYLHEAITILTDKTGCDTETARHICDRFGEHNILNKDELLKSYLEHGAEVSESILKSLEGKQHLERYQELEKDLFEIKAVLKLFE